MGFYKVLRLEESEKVVQALGYANWNDFLIKNGYVNKEGKPEMGLWTRSEYIKYGKQMREERELFNEYGNSHTK